MIAHSKERTEDFVENLNASYAACRSVAKKNSSFYLGMMVLPIQQRNAMYAMYAWLRAADDFADDESLPEATRLKNLNHFYKTTKMILKHDPSYCQRHDAPYWLAFRETIFIYQIPVKYLKLMIDGQKLDLVKHTYTSFKELYRYCYLVASSVGFICMKIWRCEENPKTTLMAEKLGIAMQLTNVLRDMMPDLTLKRVYIPSQMFAAKPLSVSQFKRLSKKKLLHSIHEIIQITQNYYTESKDLYLTINTRASLSCLILFATYQQIFRKISANPKLVLSKTKIRLNLLDKVHILSVSLARYAKHCFTPLIVGNNRRKA